MWVTMILMFPASYCQLARGITQVYFLYFQHYIWALWLTAAKKGHLVKLLLKVGPLDEALHTFHLHSGTATPSPRNFDKMQDYPALLCMFNLGKLLCIYANWVKYFVPILFCYGIHVASATSDLTQVCDWNCPGSAIGCRHAILSKLNCKFIAPFTSPKLHENLRYLGLYLCYIIFDTKDKNHDVD